MSNMTGYWNIYAEAKEVGQVNTQMNENNQMSHYISHSKLKFMIGK